MTNRQREILATLNRLQSQSDVILSDTATDAEKKAAQAAQEQIWDDLRSRFKRPIR